MKSFINGNRLPNLNYIPMKRVVIIDDDDIFLFLCSKALENVGFTEEIKKFTDGKNGLQYLLKENEEEHFPTLLMIDINMPLVSGWEIVETLETKKPALAEKCKIYILSSSIDVRDKERALAYKTVAGFIIKPVSEGYFLEMARDDFGLSHE